MSMHPSTLRTSRPSELPSWEHRDQGQKGRKDSVVQYQSGGISVAVRRSPVCLDLRKKIWPRCRSTDPDGG